ncbi:phosphatidylinositol-specific phospholipase C/glycerophosphodiester phosphodiesterase family protein [Blastopirellula sp. J2-11]|uniref:phosphatidylinositol-specific phospholipase C/glycerophosphodiester phosphodiesterase family protein n=1 Tax=Blastopirellula sp. J2-11 TaxID=2943192 RepID=UPI0021C7C4C8|nr:phosphatidylinositol-specific phospholipase C/glycerophosphodiester phosphodiesterase family protein [Blastopirellula sp. J2-11]UUO08470.1 phosphatidylinositol-specific phospholipase C/glycerophosphodiester phosphodiesterase family protein [Blastopirellula sp. J2-11]
MSLLRLVVTLPLAVVGILLAVDARAEEAPLVLLRAHAHNDFHHQRPLFDALDHGFNSVEADVYLIGDQLLVAHWYHELNPRRTLETLYLDPLRKRVREGHGRVHPGSPPFRLLIDIHGDGEKVYAALAKTLGQYADILTQVRDGKVETRAIQVVASGSRPHHTIAQETLRFVGIDGRLHDLGSAAPPHLMPLISGDWRSHFSWKGKGKIPAAEREKLQRLVRQAHQEGRQIRFWGTPATIAMWKVLDDCGVDVIHTDNLTKLTNYLTASQTAQENQGR